MTLSVDQPSDGVMRVRLEVPPANALDAPTRGELSCLLDRLDADRDVRCLVITGRGDWFTAGGDLHEQSRLAPPEREEYIRGFLACLDRLESCRVPVVAAINGHCYGGGLELALCCQVRIALQSATFVASGVNVGLIVSFQRLPQTIGHGRALEMLLTGATYSAAEAERWGLVNRLCGSRLELDADAISIAERIASRAPLSVQATKRAALRAFELSRIEAREEQVERFVQMSATADHAEALRAFREKRRAGFCGR
jgi:enoyl-CoA hydratase